MLLNNPTGVSCPRETEQITPNMIVCKCWLRRAPVRLASYLQDGATRMLKMILSAAEAVEVFVEIAARQSSNPRLRWILIFCLEVLK